MEARLDYSSSEILQKFAKHLNAAAAASSKSGLPADRRISASALGRLPGAFVVSRS